MITPLLPLKSGNLLIPALVEDMKPVVAVKDDFACRGKSKVMAYIGTFGITNSDARKKSEVGFVNRSSHVSTFGQRPRWKIPILWLQRSKSFNTEKKHHKLAIVGISEDQYSNAKKKPTVLPFGQFSQLKVFSLIM